MKTNLEKLLSKFQKGKHSTFLTLSELLIPELQDWFYHKLKNQALSEHLTLHTMDQLLNHMYARNFALGETDFYNELFQLADLELKKHQNLIQDQSKTENFEAQLKLRLQTKLQAKREQDPNYFAFYWHHFRFYFMGACFAAGIGVLAFLLGFISFHKYPHIFKKNPKLYTMTGDQAFGELSKEHVDEVGIFQSLDAFSSIFTPLPKQYRITEKQIPSLPKTIKVAQEKSNSAFVLGNVPFLSQFPTLQIPKLLTGELLSFESVMSGYILSFDMDTKYLDLELRNLESYPDVSSPLSSQKAIIKDIKKQLQKLGLSLQQYGDFEEFPLDELKSEYLLSFRLPFIFQDKEVYGEDLIIEYSVVK